MPVLHHSEFGEGKPLVILHGLFGSSKNWQSLGRQFARHYQVFNVDLRNHGQSFHADSMNYPAMVDDVVEWLDKLDLPRVHLLGHSMGGKVAMMLAAMHPLRLEQLIVADIAPVAYQHHYDDLIDPILDLSLEVLESREQADRLLQQAIPEASLRAFLLQNLARDTDGWRWRVNWQVIRRDIAHLTDFTGLDADWRIDTPTLVIRGANSDYVGAAEIELIKQHIPHAHFESLANAGHWLHAEQPAAFQQQVLDFLNPD